MPASAYWDACLFIELLEKSDDARQEACEDKIGNPALRIETPPKPTPGPLFEQPTEEKAGPAKTTG